MSSDRSKPLDYEVGYGKPPRHSQFKPGQSGNPSGRPKGSQSLSTVLLREMNAPLTIRENGRERRITKMEAAIKQLVNKAATGDTRSLTLLLGLQQSMEAVAANTPAAPLSSQADAELKRELLRRIQAATKEAL